MPSNLADPEQCPADRIAARIEYRGTGYCGWQFQHEPHIPAVQNTVEHALSSVADHSIKVYCAGRTDSGVHATAQIIHFETTASRTCYQWLRGCNSNLPADIRARWFHPVDDSFHARFSATARCYRYIIDNRAVSPGLYHGLHAWIAEPLDEKLMHIEAQCLLGEHDFSAFRAAGCQAKTATRTVRKLSVTRCEHLIHIDIEANAFLQHMVRNIVGVLTAVGAGRERPGWTQVVLDSRDRTQGGVTASPYGLRLTGVRYPGHFDLPPTVD